MVYVDDDLIVSMLKYIIKECVVKCWFTLFDKLSFNILLELVMIYFMFEFLISMREILVSDAI